MKSAIASSMVTALSCIYKWLRSWDEDSYQNKIPKFFSVKHQIKQWLIRLFEIHQKHEVTLLADLKAWCCSNTSKSVSFDSGKQKVLRKVANSWVSTPLCFIRSFDISLYIDSPIFFFWSSSQPSSKELSDASGQCCHLSTVPTLFQRGFCLLA